MPDDETLQAFMYGPLVLAGQLGTQGLTRDVQYGDPFNARGGKFLRGDPIVVPEFQATSRDPAAWIVPVADQPVTFRTTGQKQNVTLVPLNRLFEQRFAVYWRVRQG
jgi:hypothetical protein